MVGVRRRLQGLASFAGGLLFALSLAAVFHVGSTAERAEAAVVAVLPFALALLTGVAKTTTA